MPFYIAKNLLICAVALLLTAASGSLAAAGNRIATVDLEKVFNSYYKTKIIDQDFTDQGKVYRNYIQRQAEQLRTMENKFRQKLLQQVIQSARPHTDTACCHGRDLIQNVHAIAFVF